MTESLVGGTAAAPLSIRAAAALTSAVVRAARQLLTDLERGHRIDAAVLRGAMEAAFGASDATGAWDWKIAYDACELATVLFLRKFGSAIRAKAGSPAARLPILAKIEGCLPTHTRRSEESQARQQFSTPIPLGVVACTAAAITPADRLLEPSAGTGLLAIFAELAGGALVLNQLAKTRAALLDHLFPSVKVTRFDAAQIDDHLDVGIAPSVVLMNTPFSVMVNVDHRMADATLRHVASALPRLCDGGRLVAITGASFAPDNPAWTDAFATVPEFKSSTIYLVTGLLLPIWRRLPHESTRIYRLQSDIGERIIGRKVSPAWVAAATEASTSNLTPDAAFTALLDGKVTVDLTETLELRRVRVMGADRIELTGFTETMRDRLRADGLFSEIISWKLRFFVPVDTTGSAVLARVLEHHPVADRAVA